MSPQTPIDLAPHHESSQEHRGKSTKYIQELQNWNNVDTHRGHENILMEGIIRKQAAVLPISFCLRMCTTP